MRLVFGYLLAHSNVILPTYQYVTIQGEIQDQTDHQGWALGTAIQWGGE